MRDLENNTTIKLSNSFSGGDTDGGSHYPQFTRDSEYVYFESTATNTLNTGEDTNSKRDVFLYHIKTGTMERISISNDGTQGTGESYLYTEM